MNEISQDPSLSPAARMWAEGEDLAKAAAARETNLTDLIQVALCDYGEQHLLWGWDSIIRTMDGDDCKGPARWVAMYLREAAKVKPSITTPFAGWL